MLVAGRPAARGHDEERILGVARLVVDRAGVLPLRVGVNRGARLRRRLRADVPADLLDQGRRHQPGGPGDGEGRARRGAGHRRAWSARSQTVSAPPSCPPFMVKGKAQPVRAAEVGALVGVRAARTGPRAARRAVTQEMAVLGAALARRAGRRGRLVEIVGEAGHRQVAPGRRAAERRP